MGGKGYTVMSVLFSKITSGVIHWSEDQDKMTPGGDHPVENRSVKVQ